jgi:3-hydroxyisobutyrate dehydrogenase-like beta-hydroxyacid dehydrogenase
MMDAAHPIGFIGLGTMGEAMALTLVKAGMRLLVWNRTRAKAEILAAAGADVAREAADVFERSATVFLMLVDGGAIDTVLDRGWRCLRGPGDGTHGRAREWAGEAGVASPLLDVCHALYGETRALGFGDADMAAVLKAIEARSDLMDD